MTADRSRVDTWLRKLEETADNPDIEPLSRAYAFRQTLTEAWNDGWDRGYSDHNDDTWRADSTRKTERETTATDKEQP